MSRPSGTVFSYPYLWNADRQRGRTDSKDRTTCLAIRRDVAGADGTMVSHLMLIAITDQVRAEQTALRVPDTEKRRAGLEVRRPAFAIVSEYNYDVLPHSWHYAPNSDTYGSFSPRFCEEIVSVLKALAAAGRMSKVDRTSAEGGA
jgi:hypothetical protein